MTRRSVLRSSLVLAAAGIRVAEHRYERSAAAPICGHHRGPRRCFIDCSKIGTRWKIVIIFDHPSQHLAASNA